MGCCRSFYPGVCGFLRSESLRLPVKVVKLVDGVHITIAFKGQVHDLFDALDIYECEGETARLATRIASVIDSPLLTEGRYTLESLCSRLQLL